MTEKNDKGELEIEKTIVNTTHHVEHFYHSNKKQIVYALVALAVIVAAYIGIRKFYIEPMDEEAQREIFMAQKAFDIDSFNLAVKGNGTFKGFADIADQYGASKAGNLAHYYAGICYLRIGDYQNAVDQLEDFSTDDKLVAPLATGATGDAYVELGEIDKGAKLYMKAARMTKNKVTSPVFFKKAGIAYEELKEYGDALTAYNSIKKDYADSQEAMDIDKYIARATTLKEAK